jgi:transposase
MSLVLFGTIMGSARVDATLCIEGFHVVRWATDALGEVWRQVMESSEEEPHVHPCQRAQGLSLCSLAQR